jgi:hypothetical protein
MVLTVVPCLPASRATSPLDPQSPLVEHFLFSPVLSGEDGGVRQMNRLIVSLLQLFGRPRDPWLGEHLMQPQSRQSMVSSSKASLDRP